MLTLINLNLRPYQSNTVSEIGHSLRNLEQIIIYHKEVIK